MSLGYVSIVLGAIFFALAVGTMAYPGLFRELLNGFSRNRALGFALTAVDLVWVGFLLRNNSLGGYEHLKPFAYAALPAVFFLTVLLMDEMLASRALGGMLMLLPGPMLAAARWHESSWRLVIVVVAYIAAIKGMALMLSPYLMRKATDKFLATDARCRVCGATSAVVALLLLGLGVSVLCV